MSEHISSTYQIRVLGTPGLHTVTGEHLTVDEDGVSVHGRTGVVFFAPVDRVGSVQLVRRPSAGLHTLQHGGPQFVARVNGSADSLVVDGDQLVRRGAWVTVVAQRGLGQPEVMLAVPRGQLLYLAEKSALPTQ